MGAVTTAMHLHIAWPCPMDPSTYLRSETEGPGLPQTTMPPATVNTRTLLSPFSSWAVRSGCVSVIRICPNVLPFVVKPILFEVLRGTVRTKVLV